MNLKSDISYVDTSYNSIIERFLNYATILAPYIQLLTKPYKVKPYLTSDVVVCLSISQAGVGRRVLFNSIYINNEFNIHGVSNDKSQIQKWMVQHSTMMYNYRLVLIYKASIKIIMLISYNL